MWYCLINALIIPCDPDDSPVQPGERGHIIHVFQPSIWKLNSPDGVHINLAHEIHFNVRKYSYFLNETS